MADDNIKAMAIKIAMDDSGFQQGVQNLKRQLSEVDSSFMAGVAGIKDWGKNIDSLKSNASALGEKIDLQKQIIQKYQAQLEKSKISLQSNSEKMMELKDSVETAKDAWEAAQAVEGKNSDAAMALKENYESLNKEYEKTKNQVLNNNKSVEGNTIQVNEQTAKLKNLEAELGNVNKKVAESQSKWISAGKSMQTAGENMKTAGEGISSAGKSLSLGITAPLIAAGTGLFKLGSDFDEANDKIRAGTGKTGESLKQLNGDFQEVYKTVPSSLDEASTAITDLSKRVTLSNSALKDLAEQELRLSKLTGSDLSSTITSSTRMFQDAGIKQSDYSKALDYTYRVTQQTGIQIDTLQQLMAQFGGPLRQMGFDWQESAAMLGKFEKEGVNTELVVGSLRIALGKMAKEGISDPAKALQTMITRIKDAGSAGKANALALSMFGAKAGPDMAAAIREGRLDLDGLIKTLKNSPETINSAAKDTLSLTDKFELMKNKLMTGLEPTAEKLIEDIDKSTPSIEKLGDDVVSIADKFANMSDGERETLEKTLLLAAGLGPLLSLVGGGVKTVGSITGAMGKLVEKLGTASIAAKGAGAAAEVAAGVAGTGGLAGLGTALGGITIAAGPWILAGAAVAGTGYAIYKSMSQQAVPAVDLFADGMVESTKKISDANGNMGTIVSNTVVKISSNTQKMVGAYMKMNNDVSGTLSKLYLSSTKITSDTAKSLESKYTDMGNKIKSGMDKQYSDEYASMQQFFQKSSALSSTEEKNALANLQKNNVDKKVEIDNYEKQIQQILLNASNNHRALTLDEEQKISDIQDKMKTSAIKSLSDTEVESKVILERLKDYGTRITAEQASLEIKNATKTRDEAVKAANDQYEKTVASIIKMRDETHSITADQAEKLIADAKKQKDESVKKADEMKTAVVEKIKDMNSESLKDIDTTDGSIMTKWDELKKWFTNNPITRWINTLNPEYQGGANNMKDSTVTHHAAGTPNAESGIAEVAENGMELVIGRQFRMFQGGEIVLNNKDTMNLLNNSSMAGSNWGSDLIKNMAVGINSSAPLVKDAATNAANSVYRILHFSVPDEGPLSDADKYGSDFMQLLADTIDQNSDKPAIATKKVADLISQEVQKIKDDTTAKTKSLNDELNKLNQEETIALRGVKGSQRYTIQDEYTAKKNAVKNQIDLRKEQSDKEIAEIQRVGKMSKEELQQEIQDKKDLVSNINSLNDEIKNALKEKYTEDEKTQEDSLNNELDNLETWKNQAEEIINDVYSKKEQDIEDAATAQENALQAEIDALDAKTAAEDRADKHKEYTDKISDLQSQITYSHDDYNKAELQKQLKSTQSEYQMELNEEVVADKKATLQKQIDGIKNDAEKQKSILESEKQKELNNITSVYNAQKNSLNKQLADLKTFYDKKLSDANLEAESEKLIMQNNQNEIVALLNSYGDQYKVAGQTLGDRLVEGFTPAIQNIESMISSITAQITTARNNALSAAAIANTAVSSLNSSGKSVNYNVNITSPIAQSPSQQRRSMETTLRKLAYIA